MHQCVRKKCVAAKFLRCGDPAELAPSPDSGAGGCWTGKQGRIIGGPRGPRGQEFGNGPPLDHFPSNCRPCSHPRPIHITLPSRLSSDKPFNSASSHNISQFASTLASALSLQRAPTQAPGALGPWPPAPLARSINAPAGEY